jgi:phenylalanyl-tRNA synthetase beta chain
MKIPYKWIQEFVDLRLSPAEAADRLLNAGIEVAAVAPLAPDVRGVVIGEIEAIERELGESHGHRLLLCRVSTGSQTFSVICGAPNTKVGVRAAFAPPGAVLPGDRRIGTATIRGAESQGMLCSERELGLGEEHEAGILVLDGDAPLGQDLVAHLGLDDQVLDVEVTPNRPDCLSVLGVARELAALTGARLRVPKLAPKESGEPASRLVRVRVEAPDLCHRFTARVMRGVTVGPSPAWLQARLRAVGLRPITNVVDVTNYVLWELGHPLHAFDYDTVTDATIVVRRARAGERFTTLDGQERGLDDSMLVIADPRRAIGIAGVMGGADTEVTDGTTRVLLESAWFDPVSIRRTSRALGLRTDAAYRFERGADVEALVGASARAAQLIAELAGGTAARGMVDAYPRRRKARRITLRMERVNRVLGVAPPPAKAKAILAGLGLPTRQKGRGLEVEVPSFRRDLALEDDLVEEIIRVWGYDKLPSIVPGSASTPPAGGQIIEVRGALPSTLVQAQTVRRTLVGAGLAEAITHAFSDPARAALLRAPGAPEPLRLLNPLSQDASLLRIHPLEGVLAAVSVNVRRQQPDVALFEICKTYEADAGETGAREPRWVAIALAGARAEHAWHTADARVDVYDAKGLAEHVLDALGVPTRPGGAGRLRGFESDCHGTLVREDGTIAAEFGEVSAQVREVFSIDAPVFAAVISLDVAAATELTPLRYQVLPRFPAVQRDLAFVVGAEQSLTAAEIEAKLLREAGPLLRRVTLVDVFRFPDGRRSLAWRLTFQAEDRTLTDDEVNRLQERITGAITGAFGITLRSA